MEKFCIYNIKQQIDFIRLKSSLVKISDNFIEKKIYFVDKIYKSFADGSGNNQSEFRINPKYALGTTLLEPGFIFDSDRVLQSFYSKISI